MRVHNSPLRLLLCLGFVIPALKSLAFAAVDVDFVGGLGPVVPRGLAGFLTGVGSIADSAGGLRCRNTEGLGI